MAYAPTIAASSSPSATLRWRVALWTLSLLVAVGMGAYYWCIVENIGVATDIQAHLEYLVRVCADNYPMPANSGFHALTWLLAGFSCDLDLLLKTAVPLLGLSWGAVAYASAQTGRRVLAPLAGTAQWWPAAVAAVLSCVVFPWPIDETNYYLGLLPPNVYHNSTWLMALPFTMAAFGLGLRQLVRGVPGQRLNVYLALALVLGAWFKPSYAFAFVPAYGLLVLPRAGWRPAALLAWLWPLVPVGLFIVGQSWWIAGHPEASGGGAGSQFALAFPAGWRMFRAEFTAEQTWLAFGSSFAVPILAYVVQPRWLRRPSHQLALLSVVVAFAQFMLVHEVGERAGHGNFIWQVIAANHVLYWLLLHDALSALTQRQSWLARLGVLLLLLALAACVYSGATYLDRIPATKSYF